MHDITYGELMEYSKEIRELYSIPPIPISFRKMTRTLGHAWWGSNPRISLANMIMDNRYLAISVLIHEYAHIITRDHHTEKFFKINDELHEYFGLKEIRHTKTYHGDIYKGDKLVFKGYEPKRKTRQAADKQIDYASLL